MTCHEMKVIIIEHILIVGYGIKSLVEQVEHGCFVGIAESGEYGLELVEKHQPHIVFLDIDLPDIPAMEVAQQIYDRYPNVKLVILFEEDYPPHPVALIKVGASCILRKDVSPERISNLLESLLIGDVRMPRNVCLNVGTRNPYAETLTERQSNIMRLLTKGKTTEEIAEEVYVCRRTVEKEFEDIKELWAVGTKIEAVVKFVREMD